MKSPEDVLIVDGTTYGRGRPAWVVANRRIRQDAPGSLLAFVGADDAEQARARALELLCEHPAFRFGIVLDHATTTVERAPDGATIADAIAAIVLYESPENLARAELVMTDGAGTPSGRVH